MPSAGSTEELFELRADELIFIQQGANFQIPEQTNLSAAGKFIDD